MRHEIKITYKNGHSITTEINGTEEEICNYYLGNYFNVGTEKDNMQQAVAIEFLNWKDRQ